MYKILPIDGKEYKLEYTIEAALYDNCVEKIIDFFGKLSVFENEESITNGMEKDKKFEVRVKLMQQALSGVFNLPETALVVFYAGLLEYHGECGDNTVKTINDAKQIVKKYFQEHAEDGKDNFYDLLSICMQQMEEDGFLKRTGLETFLSQIKMETKKLEEKLKPNRATRRAKASAK